MPQHQILQSQPPPGTAARNEGPKENLNQFRQAESSFGEGSQEINDSTDYEVFATRSGAYIHIRYEFLAAREITNPTSRLPGHAHDFSNITGSTPRLSGRSFWTFKQAQEFVDRYPVGQEVEVFYDPTNPKRNCLDREDRRGIQLLWVGAAITTLCTAVLAWFFVIYPM